MKRFLKLLVASLVSVLLAPMAGCSIFSDDPTCDDVPYYNDRAQEAGQKDFDEDSMNEYVAAREDLDAAEQDCYAKGERPQYG